MFLLGANIGFFTFITVCVISITMLWFVGIRVIQVVAGPRVKVSTSEGFALALTDSGSVYSWGKGYKGRLGHSTVENIRSPKLIEALATRNIKMVTI